MGAISDFNPRATEVEMAWHFNKLLETDLVFLESKQNTYRCANSTLICLNLYSSCAVISTKLNSILKHSALLCTLGYCLSSAQSMFLQTQQKHNTQGPPTCPC
ncbi:hypothetical protein PROFUN_09451 [Planoprotostelium fungivorum]|uniref:Uncharacterized protein n=1 Tax=Planoprotostelium fungivorum TaxID=1890364 RepID=A0A2P6NH19_9EUKA|nr:hypothetical protein PROFUN_09451 [Planoprotostelium fungivorum]